MGPSRSQPHTFLFQLQLRKMQEPEPRLAPADLKRSCVGSLKQGSGAARSKAVAFKSQLELAPEQSVQVFRLPVCEVQNFFQGVKPVGLVVC